MVIWVKLIKEVRGLPYKIGDRLPARKDMKFADDKGHKDVVWGGLKTLIVLPKDSYIEEGE